MRPRSAPRPTDRDIAAFAARQHAATLWELADYRRGPDEVTIVLAAAAGVGPESGFTAPASCTVPISPFAEISR